MPDLPDPFTPAEETVAMLYDSPIDAQGRIF